MSWTSPGDFSILKYDDCISDRLSTVPVNELSVSYDCGADMCFHRGIFVRRIQRAGIAVEEVLKLQCKGASPPVSLRKSKSHTGQRALFRYK